MIRHLASALLTLPLIACASSGTRPSDMTGAEHEAHAAAERKESTQHARQYDPNALTCPPYVPGECSPYWRSATNPTERHAEEAVKHRQLAEKHRAASAVLRDAEASACQGIPAADRDMSPFNHREDIVRVERIEREVLGPGGLRGARVIFRAQPGMTAESLQRLVDCHVARWAALGIDDPDVAYCPLALNGVSAKVKSVVGGFAVEIVAKDEKTAGAVVGRAQALAPQS